ncbi:MAG: acetyl-CoA hydrolase/transferase C-terminal domain-containing protein [Glycocaulis sp.]
MNTPRPATAEACVDLAIQRVGKRVVLGLPLGLGKANHLANAFYARAKADPRIELTIFTALTLERPAAPNALAARLLDPISERLYDGYPDLEYARDRRRNALPANVRVKEFFLPPGGLLNNASAQRDYVSANYTHAGRAILEAGVNVVAQMVAPGPPGRLSLSCNSDLSLDMIPALHERRKNGAPAVVLGEINTALPFLGKGADIPEDWFDALHDAGTYTLFPIPREAVGPPAWSIGLHVSTLVRDGGTLQTGIGALSDAVAAALKLRHLDNGAWRTAVGAIGADMTLAGRCGGLDPFKDGLYGCSEMLTLGLLDLFQSGLLGRRVSDDITRQQALLTDPASLREDEGIALHGGFFAGPGELYDRLRKLSDTERARIDMTSVARVNDLYGHEELARLQRQHARFINTAMMVNGRGAAISDTLADGRVVSGVGGQYNFSAMAHELEGARSIILVRATRQTGGETRSNIVWTGGEVTVPRHLRDIVVTEYGVADLRGRTDREVAIALAQIADSRFQEAFLDEAKSAGKVDKDYALPERARQNTPEHLTEQLQPAMSRGTLVKFPFGSDLSETEQALREALEWLAQRNAGWKARAGLIASALLRGPEPHRFATELKRMNLMQPAGLKERLEQKLVCLALSRTANS